jgi:ferric-dicitrate binding protein FerR (iron transport regulator)
MEQNNAKQILSKYRAGTATETEKAFIENWIVYGAAGNMDLTDEELLHDLTDIRQRLKIDQPQQKVIRLWQRLAAAAAVLLFMSTAAYFILHKQPQSQLAAIDFAPGNNKAILTLANGKNISLTDAKLGVLANENITAIDKTTDGEVVYRTNNKIKPAGITYNTITSPRAGKWSVVLPDGTKAWLDDMSSIRFPTVFNGTNRTVEITGQVYFEVVHNAAHPFRVIANGQTIEDIGTHFNVSAYNEDAAVKITLLEGSVKVSKGDKKVILKPGQQSVVSTTSDNMLVENTDTGNAVAWKDGYFAFKKASIQTVMREFSRWYDVDVAYEGKTPTSMITGKVPRNVNASQALKILSYMDIHFRIEDKKIIITP